MVITTVKEPCVVAIVLLHSNVTSVGVLIRHWTERATKVRVVAFTFALMAKERGRPVRKLWRCVSARALLPEMVENRHRHVSIIAAADKLTITFTR